MIARNRAVEGELIVARHWPAHRIRRVGPLAEKIDVQSLDHLREIDRETLKQRANLPVRIHALVTERSDAAGAHKQPAEEQYESDKNRDGHEKLGQSEAEFGFPHPSYDRGRGTSLPSHRRERVQPRQARSPSG
jgi:hypothetical protein